MAEKLMYITNDDTQTSPFYSVRLVVETFEHLTYESTNQNSQKLLSQQIRKRYYKTLGTSVLCIPLPLLTLYSRMNECFLIL